MPKSQTDTINPTVLYFKPRQVLLSETKMKTNSALKPEQKSSLLQSVAGYLQSNGFSKTLKKFLSEAHLEKLDDSATIMSLEEIFCRYLETCDHGGKQSNGQKVQDSLMNDKSLGGKEVDSALDEGIVDKKKKTSDDNGHAIVDQKGNNTEHDFNLKSKDKKKKKKTSDSQGPSEKVSSEVIKEPVDTVVSDQQVQDSDEKLKEKKKKKKKGKLDSETVIGEVDKQNNFENLDRTETKEHDSKIVIDNSTDKEDKQSKKRKRSYTVEDKSQPTNESKKLKGNEQATELNGTIGKSNIKEEDGEKSAPRSNKKETNGSAGPTTAKAFQRVKVEEVVFTDDRLKDNSYWAKDGADTGYGAKAQEVLGQVKGRGFRHEKTKKKRGSYRGGLIDVQSHSVKFNYSDEE